MIYSKKLQQFKEIKHGFSEREDGKMGQMRVMRQMKGIILANQVHEDNVEIVTKADVDGIIVKTDGLLTKKKGIALGIRTADCLPILFYEPKAKIVGAVHAGRKGTLLGITGKMIEQICQIGGIEGNIICVLGPHICGKCYYVKDKYIDLTKINVNQLLKARVKKENIEILPYCTFHQNERFFSYRKNFGKNYGEMLNFISLI